MSKLIILITMVIVLELSSVAFLFAASLQWEPVESTQHCTIAGYYVYYGLEQEHPTNVIDVGDVSYLELDDLELETSLTYYIAVSAYSTTGQEGPLSRTVLYPNNVISFNANPEYSDNSFADIFKDNQGTTEWYRLWIGNGSGTKGEYVDTSALSAYVKGWILKDDLQALKVKEIPFGANHLWVGCWDSETREITWYSGFIDFSYIGN